jgi:hypothetical protein
MPPTAAGWTIMIVSIGAVCALTAYCFYKVLTLPPREVTEHLKAPLDIDTKDTRDAD